MEGAGERPRWLGGLLTPTESLDAEDAQVTGGKYREGTAKYSAKS